MSGLMGKIVGGIIGGLVGGPWGAAIGVGLGHLVDSEDEPKHNELGSATGRVVDVNIKTGRFSELDPNIDVVWAQVGIETDAPGSLGVAMTILADDQPVRALHRNYQGPDGEVIVPAQGPGYEYGNRIDFDLVIPTSVMDIPVGVRRLQAVTLLYNDTGIVDSKVKDFTLSVHTGRNNSEYKDILNVLWGAVIADGNKDRLEVREVRLFLEREMGLSHYDMQEVKGHLHSLNLTTSQALDSARLVAQSYNKQMKNRLTDIIVDIIAADGKVTKEEEAYVVDIGRIFGLSENDLDRIFQTHNTAGRLRALMVLGLDSSAKKDEINRKFKELALKYHPDHLMNMDEDFQRLGAMKFRRIKQAYDILKGK